MNKSDHDFGMANGHSPVAHKVICVDFDDTLFPWGPIFNYDVGPLPGAVSAMQQFRRSGFRIVIFTSRLSPTWLRATYPDDWRKAEANQRIYIDVMLDAYDIPYDDMTSEKIPAVAYIDDKAIRVYPRAPDAGWLAVQREVLTRG